MNGGVFVGRVESRGTMLPSLATVVINDAAELLSTADCTKVQRSNVFASTRFLLGECLKDYL